MPKGVMNWRVDPVEGCWSGHSIAELKAPAVADCPALTGRRQGQAPALSANNRNPLGNPWLVQCGKHGQSR